MVQFLMESPILVGFWYWFKIIILFVFILFLDSVRRANQSDQHIEEAQDRHSETYHYATRFYSQRNAYMTGFTLFLSLLLFRLSTLVLDAIKHEEKLTHVTRQAQSQTKAYTDLLEKYDTLVKERKEQSHKSVDVEVTLKQAKQTQEAYLSLLEKYQALERQVERQVQVNPLVLNEEEMDGDNEKVSRRGNNSKKD